MTLVGGARLTENATTGRMVLISVRTDKPLAAARMYLARSYCRFEQTGDCSITL